jgi:uncharacterized protein (DUF58 family)
VSRVRPTRRGVLVLAGAAIAYLVGWAFGTRELAVLALALALAVVLAGASVWFASRSAPRMLRRLPPRAVAGEVVEASIRIDLAPRLVSAVVVDRSAELGDPVAPLMQAEGGLEGTWRVAEPARGRYLLAPELVLEDVLGLARTSLPLAAAGRLRVEPRLVELGGARTLTLAQRDGARHAFASNAGDGLAGVRDHEVGESLRRVHWRTTARRGRLTVRELEDHPREELHVLLDAAQQGPGQGARARAFECAVRAAGSLAAHAARGGISVSFESHGAHEQRVAVAAGTRAALLDALCSVEADGTVPLAAQLARTGGGRLCVVTSDLGPAVVERLRALHVRRRPVAVVAIDRASFGEPPSAFEEGVATLVRAGVDVAVVRQDDDLAHALAPILARGVEGAA